MFFINLYPFLSYHGYPSDRQTYSQSEKLMLENTFGFIYFFLFMPSCVYGIKWRKIIFMNVFFPVCLLRFRYTRLLKNRKLGESSFLCQNLSIFKMKKKKRNFFTILGNEFKFEAKVYINQLHLYVKFQLSNSNYLLLRNLPNHIKKARKCKNHF